VHHTRHTQYHAHISLLNCGNAEISGPGNSADPPENRLHGEIGLVPTAEFEAHYNITRPAQHPAPREIHASIKPGT